MGSRGRLARGAQAESGLSRVSPEAEMQSRPARDKANVAGGTQPRNSLRGEQAEGGSMNKSLNGDRGAGLRDFRK